MEVLRVIGAGCKVDGSGPSECLRSPPSLCLCSFPRAMPFEPTKGHEWDDEERWSDAGGGASHGRDHKHVHASYNAREHMDLNHAINSIV